MKLQRREKILGGVALGLVGLVALYFLLIAGDSRSTEQLIGERSKLELEIKTKNDLLKAAARDAKRMSDWQHRSLPADPATAKSLYQNWLRGLASRVNFRSPTIAANEAGSRRDQFTRISFAVRAHAALGDLVDFLYEFYSVGYLHQIRKMDIKPVPNSRELDVNMTIEALSLPSAEAKTELPKEAGHGLKLPKLADYRSPIVSRNLFAGYVRPKPPPSAAPPPRRRERPSVDPADYAFVTGFTEVDGAAQVWLQDRIVGKLWKLGDGESFAIGKMQGKIEAIAPDGEVIVEFDGRRRRLRRGDNLHGGVEIKGETPGKTDRGN